MTPNLTLIAVCASAGAIAFAVLWLLERDNRKRVDHINADLRADVELLRAVSWSDESEAYLQRLERGEHLTARFLSTAYMEDDRNE